MKNDWIIFSLHFRQQFERGYLFFDRCGAYMNEAVDKYGFLETEIKPTGAKLSIPEIGLSAQIDSKEIVVSQETPQDGGEAFLNHCINLSTLADKFFEPKLILRNGFACQLCRRYQDPQLLLDATLKIGKHFGLSQTSPIMSKDGSIISSAVQSPATENKETVSPNGLIKLDISDFQERIAQAIGLEPAKRALNFSFKSGPREAQLEIKPITFERISGSKFSAAPGSIRPVVERFEKMNKHFSRIDFTYSHALSIEFDVTEDLPPNNSFQGHFHAMREGIESIKEEVTAYI